MTMIYSVIPGDSTIFPLGSWLAWLEGYGKFTNIRWHKLECSDCVWIVPGTEDCQP